MPDNKLTEALKLAEWALKTAVYPTTHGSEGRRKALEALAEARRTPAETVGRGFRCPSCQGNMAAWPCEDCGSTGRITLPAPQPVSTGELERVARMVHHELVTEGEIPPGYVKLLGDALASRPPVPSVVGVLSIGLSMKALSLIKEAADTLDRWSPGLPKDSRPMKLIRELRDLLTRQPDMGAVVEALDFYARHHHALNTTAPNYAAQALAAIKGGAS